jgi:vitamin B12 transporter
MFSSIKSSVALVAFATSFSIQAQTPLQNDTVDTITVTSSRLAIPANELAGFRQILTRDDIERSQAQFLSDILPTFAGVDISNNGGTGQFAELRVRGGETNHLVVLLDGIQINDQAQGGLIDLAHIPLSSIESIELLQGTSGAQWGDGALSGVLSITTLVADRNQHTVNIDLGLHRTANVALTQTIKQDSYRHSLSVSAYHTDGQNISVVEGQRERDGYQNMQFVYKPTIQLSDASQLQGFLRYTEYVTAFDETDFAVTGLPIDADSESNGVKQTFSLHYTQALSDNVTLNAQWQNQRDAVKNTANGALTSASDTDEHRYLAWVTVNHSDMDVSAGVQFSDIDFTQKGPIGFGDPNQAQNINSEAFFADTAYRVTDELVLTGSMRLTQNSDFDQSRDYTLGASYHARPNLRVFVQSGRASKNPTFTERFGFFAGTFQGNPNLKPEVADNKEIGLAWSAQNTSIQLSIFDTNLKNEINGFVFDANSGGFTADNVDGTSQRQGWQWQSSMAFDSWDLAVHYSYTDASDGSASELRRSRHNASVTTNITLAPQWSLQGQALYQGSQLDQFFPPWPQPSQIVKLDAYWLFNMALNIELDAKHSIGLSGRNLLDKDYSDIVGYRGKERTLQLSYRYLW